LRPIRGSFIAFFTAIATERLSGPTVCVVGENPVDGKCAVPIPAAACTSCYGKKAKTKIKKFEINFMNCENARREKCEIKKKNEMSIESILMRIFF
jgi:Zn finger protein HypA/HybF involved in hydrogenase expression